MSFPVYVVQSGAVPVRVFASQDRALTYAEGRGLEYTDSVAAKWRHDMDFAVTDRLYYRSWGTGRWRRTEWTITQVGMETRT